MSEASAGYVAAHEGAAVFDRSGRTRLRVSGRAPGQMLGGVVTGKIPDAPTLSTAGQGVSEYSTVLTPKGRMVSDLYVIALPGDGESFLLDVSEAGGVALLEHFKRVMPPRFAKVEDASASTRHFSVVGPEAGDAVAAALGGSAETLDGLDVGAAWFGGDDDGLCVTVRSSATIPPCFDVFCDGNRAAVLERALTDAGAVPGGPHEWDTLRVEAGTPKFGSDMTDTTIPIEAGIEDRAIDGTKGCYTGQEVIVRILHRGHVNRHLRTLRPVESTSTLHAGAELFTNDGEKPVGHVTSAVDSPRVGVLGLGYVRREVDLGSTVRLGAPDGPGFVVHALGPV